MQWKVYLILLLLILDSSFEENKIQENQWLSVNDDSILSLIWNFNQNEKKNNYGSWKLLIHKLNFAWSFLFVFFGSGKLKILLCPFFFSYNNIW